MKSKNDRLIEQLRSVDPASTENLDQPLWGASASELLRTILASEPQQPEQRHPARLDRSRQKLTRKRMLAPLAVAAVAALALAVGFPGGVGGNHDAAAALNNVADAAAAQSPPTADAPYLYLKTRSTSVNTAIAKGRSWSVYHSETREEWTAKNGSGRLRVVEDPSRFVGPADRAAWEAAGSLNFLPSGFEGHTVDRSVPAGTFDDELRGEDISSLPTDPEALSRYLRREAEKAHNSAPVSARTLELIGEVLRNSAAAPELRAALYEAAIKIPGIEYLGEAADPIGRHGAAVGVTSTYSGGRALYSLIYDPQTSEVLVTETTALEPVSFADAEAPLVTSATIYLSSGAVSSLSSAP